MFGNGFGGMLGRVGSSIKNMFSGQGFASAGAVAAVGYVKASISGFEH